MIEKYLLPLKKSVNSLGEKLPDIHNIILFLYNNKNSFFEHTIMKHQEGTTWNQRNIFQDLIFLKGYGNTVNKNWISVLNGNPWEGNQKEFKEKFLTPYFKMIFEYDLYEFNRIKESSMKESFFHELSKLDTIMMRPICSENYEITSLNYFSKEKKFSEKERKVIDGYLLSLKHAVDLTYMVEQKGIDYLTGLLLREPFYFLLKERLKLFERGMYDSDELHAILSLDLDKFKQVNDHYGHHVGDYVLKEVSAKLRSSVRHMDIISRYGGDEFTICLTNLKTKENIESICNKIINSVNKPIIYKDKLLKEDLTLNISASIGISTYPADLLHKKRNDNYFDIDESMETLIRKADNAMYIAKRQGGNSYIFS